MGIFSHLGKKGQSPAAKNRKTVNGKQEDMTTHADFGDTLAPLTATTNVSRDSARDTARTTAQKIDAIESAMTSEFVNSAPAVNTDSDAAAKKPRSTKAKPTSSSNGDTVAPITEFSATIPLADFVATLPPSSAPVNDATQLLPELPFAVTTIPAASVTAPVIEEAAVLFASGQTAVAEQILRAALQDSSLGTAIPVVWYMLFDLYQVTGRHAEFDALSLNFASTFEISPPAWVDAPVLNEGSQVTQKPATTPSVIFSGALDAQISKPLGRAQNLAAHHPTLRLEFGRVTTIDPGGCDLLLQALQKLQKSELELILVGAPGLIDKIRSIVQVGRRDETESPWLLLLELLRLLNREQDFEDSSIDYCVTFEVSPPAFVAPKTRVSTATEETGTETNNADESFAMPAMVAGDMQPLLQAITQYASTHDPVMLDCSQMARLDFSAAGQLLSGLAPLLDKTIEMHGVNHLVTPLLYALEMQHIVGIFPRKS